MEVEGLGEDAVPQGLGDCPRSAAGPLRSLWVTITMMKMFTRMMIRVMMMMI